MRLWVGDILVVPVKPTLMAKIYFDDVEKILYVPEGYTETLWICDEFDLEFNKNIFGDDIEVIGRYGDKYVIHGKRSFSDGPVGIAIRIEM